MKKMKLMMLLMCSLIAIAPATSSATEKKYKSIEEDGAVHESGSDAEPFKGDHPFAAQDASFGVGINYFDAFGMQGRYAYRLLDNRKFVSDFSNAVYLEGGAGVTFYGNVGANSNVTGIDFLATLRWDFQYNSTLTLFGDAGLGYNAVSTGSGKDVRGGNLFPAFGAGAFYNLDKCFAARFDLSWQFLGLGLTFKL